MHRRQASFSRQPMFPVEPTVFAMIRLHQQGDAVELRVRGRPTGAWKLRTTLVDRSGAELGRQKNAIAPDDRCRGAEPLERDPPCDVVVGAPTGRDTCLGGDAEAVRAAPLPPVLGRSQRRGYQQRHQRCDERPGRPKPDA